MIYRGGCHCGAVRFEVEAPERVVCQDCSCSICTMTGFVHLIVPKSKFRLLQGGDRLVSYRFNTGVADHKFCGTCGIKSFYIPRSNPDGIDVNVRCLDSLPKDMVIEPFDGRNWEGHGHELARLSKEPSE
ncbi:MAG: GFA family protein [Usitatibacter sp.]